MSLLIRDARVVTPVTGSRPWRGGALGQLTVLDRADVEVRGGRIESVTESGRRERTAPERVIDAAGRVVLPAFIDAHTHLCWAGDRLDEWDMKRRGASYLDILRSGGGIMSTVRAVRAASQEELAAGLLTRLDRVLREGTTTVEVKSGYGLTTADELKMLRAIRDAGASWPGTVVMTALLGHALDPDSSDFVNLTIDETLRAVHAEFPGIAIDAYCEKGAWSVEDCVRLFERARSLGHPIRVHADQFNSLGMVSEAIRLGARSVDHLEASTGDDLRRLGASQAFGVALPCCGFHVDGRYAQGRSLVDAGGALVIATNCNPGSAPCASMPMAIALAVRHCGLTTAEAICATTANAGALLGLEDRGTIEPGMRADLVLLRHTDERMLAYEFGGNPVDMVICAGAVVEGPNR